MLEHRAKLPVKNDGPQEGKCGRRISVDDRDAVDVVNVASTFPDDVQRSVDIF